MGDITSDILVLSFDSLSSPSIKLKLPEQLHGSHPLGWGIGWYPNNHEAGIVSKDPAARGSEIQMDALTDWANFRSTVYFCKAKGAARGYTHHETQPFMRSFAGKDWLFMHNGDLDKQKLAELHKDKSRLLEPLGKTDSELAFCYLLGKVMETEARNLIDIPYHVLLGWFEQLDALGSADMCISDGINIVVFCGTQSVRNLYYTRVQPPLQARLFNSETALLDLNDPRDSYRTSLIISSCQFDTGDWTPMQPGQLLIACRGNIVWNSKAGQLPPESPQPPISQSLPHFYEDKPTDETLPAYKSILNIRSITRAADGTQLTFRTFDISHLTRYTYTEPVKHSTHTFRLQPVEDPIQEVVRASVTLSVEGEQIQYQDVFGNESTYYSINKPYTELSIHCQSRIKVYGTPLDDYSLSQRKLSFPLVWMPWQRQMMLPYLLPMELPETQLLELTDYATSFVERNGYHLLETLKDINYSIFSNYKYMPGITSVNTTPFEVYMSRQGVCQDFANLFICMARLLNIPARYRMGYIYTGVNYQNKIQSDASHAWVEIYIPYVGWRGFDPTNGVMVNQDHVRVACGRNYRDATPTSGTIFKGAGIENLVVEVKMDEILTI